jgi:hypothetical protein
MDVPGAQRRLERGDLQSLERALAELLEVVESLSDYCSHDLEVQAFVVVHRNVPEPDHLLEALSQVRVDDTPSGEQTKRVAAFLRDAQSFDAHEMHGQVDRALASPLQIQENRILARKIVEEVCVLAAVFLSDTSHGPFNRRHLIQQHIVRHECDPAV